MLSQVAKLVTPGSRSDLAARFRAWWDGRDYVPADPAIEGEGADSPAAPVEPSPEAGSQPVAPVVAPPESSRAARAKRDRRDTSDDSVDASGVSPRIRALETLWGEGRFGPGSSALDNLLLDEAFGGADSAGPLAFIGADAALVAEHNRRSERGLFLSDWRNGCAARVHELVSGASVELGEPDRPRGLPAGRLAALISVDAFAFSDHKSGLVARAYKSLSDTGRWVILDTTRNTRRTPPEAFASAWAEPQLGTAEEIEEVLALAGFGNVRRIAVADLLLQTARDGYARLGGALGSSVKSGMDGRQGTIFLQELAWEAASWRARILALEGGALGVDLWIAEKAGAPSAAAPAARPKSVSRVPVAVAAPKTPPPAEPEPQIEEAKTEPLDQSSIDSLFD